VARRRAILAAAVVALLAAVAIAVVADRGGVPGSRPATLAEYWGGEARWELARRWTATELGQLDPWSGAHIEVVGDRWYLFNRAHRGGTCPDGERRVGVQVRASPDGGATWGPPVGIVEPTPGTPWSCAGSDGDALYDAAGRTWRYLFQCKTETSGWQGCYVERRGASPMGPFTGSQNPVIRSGELWGQICDPGDDCAAQPVREEGTFNVFRRDGRGYWISFHGAAGIHGYRGIARTPDFSPGSFVVDRPEAGVPADAILDAKDAAGFREQWAPGGPIGAGAGSIVEEGEYLYALNEFPDVSLACREGQNWDLGLFRSRSAAETEWEPFPGGNPIVRSSRAPESNGQPAGCNVVYPTLFRGSDGTWHMLHGRASSDPRYSGLYLYRLVEDTSILVNDDFRTGDTQGWSRHPGSTANVAAPRTPNGSPDGTSYLALNCGASPCPPGHGVYQDVELDDADGGAGFAFGGQLRSEAGHGSLDLVVHQLAADGGVLASDTVPVSATGAYATVEGRGRLHDGVRRLRFELYPKTPETFGADNLFLRVDD
jgi:hypothetical protein